MSLETLGDVFTLRFKPTGARRVHAGRRVRIYRWEVKSACGEWYVPEDSGHVGIVDDPVTCKACQRATERALSISQRYAFGLEETPT